MAGKNQFEAPYERLANAIILSAVADYRAALKKVKRNPKSKTAIDEALQIEKFFRSSWYPYRRFNQTISFLHTCTDMPFQIKG